MKGVRCLHRDLNTTTTDHRWAKLMGFALWKDWPGIWGVIEFDGKIKLENFLPILCNSWQRDIFGQWNWCVYFCLRWVCKHKMSSLFYRGSRPCFLFLCKQWGRLVWWKGAVKRCLWLITKWILTVIKEPSIHIVCI